MKGGVTHGHGKMTAGVNSFTDGNLYFYFVLCTTVD